jgi:hypothetical protein
LDHNVLVATPLNHPDYENAVAIFNGFERARQRIAVIDIGSTSKKSKLLLLGGKDGEERIKKLIRLCQQFCRETVKVLRTGAWRR